MENALETKAYNTLVNAAISASMRLTKGGMQVDRKAGKQLADAVVALEEIRIAAGKREAA